MTRYQPIIELCEFARGHIDPGYINRAEALVVELMKEEAEVEPKDAKGTFRPQAQKGKAAAAVNVDPQAVEK